MFWYIILTLILVGITYLVIYLSTFYRLHTFGGTRIIPGEKPDWVVGNLRKTGVLSGTPIHHGLLKYQQQFGDYFQYFLGSDHFLVLCKPEHAQYILSRRNIYEGTPTTKANFELMFENGMICLRGETHRRHARVILPMLKKNRALEFVTNMSDATDLLISQWERAYKHQQTEGKDPDIAKGLKHTQLLKHIQALTLDLIGEISYGQTCGITPNLSEHDLTSPATTTINPQNGKIETLAQATAFMIHRFTQMVISGLPMWVARIILKFDNQWKQARKIIFAFVEKHIAESRDAEVTTATEQVNMIRRLVGALSRDNEPISDDKNVLSRDEVVDELLLMIVAGYETSSTVLSWWIVYMCRYPDVQQRIKDEIRKVIPKESGIPAPLSQSQLDALEYMDCVVKETLRLAPISPFFSRASLVEDEIDGIKIPAGQDIAMASYCMHLDPRLWKVDPTKYCPDRFFGENAPDKNHHPYAFLPFGGGAHGCAGQELARIEMKAIMTRLMQRITFHDTPDNKATETQRITTVPTGLCVRITWD